MIPGKIWGGAAVKEGRDSLELSDDNIDDRIINLKFIRGKTGRGFTIRSDYEPVFHNDGLNGSISFKPCVEKPDIKITYKQVAESVSIEVDIEINNFNVGDAEFEDAQSMYSVSGDPVTECIIQMGYRAQFHNWAKEPKQDVKQYYELDDLDDMTRKRQQIRAQILTGYMEAYPPDNKVIFKGIIGTMENGLRWNHTEADLVKDYGDAEFPDGYTEIEAVLFQTVTRRFVRSSVVHRIETGQDFKQEVYVNGDMDNPLTLVKGIMSVKDAKKYGVICSVSKTLRDIPANAVFGYGLTEEEAAVLYPTPSTPFNKAYDTLGGQLVAIQQHYPFIRWYALSNGDFFFYHEDDEDEDLWSDDFIKTLQKKAVRLPAIYDMTPAGTRVIRCPYISFISPMFTVLFQSRHTIGTLTSYFYPVKTKAFLVILAKVEFATVQDFNMMELTCVDYPRGEIKFDEDTGEILQDKTPEVSKLQERRNMQWFEKELTVVLHRTNALDTDSRWENIISNSLVVFPERWPEGELPAEKDKLAALMKWNPDYFDPDKEYMKRGNSIENGTSGIGEKGRTGVKVPWLYVGDKITVRYPFQPEYPKDENVGV